MTAQRAPLQPVKPSIDVDALCAKFTNKTAKIGIIGLGYVGLP
ncbi:MAG: hypothetical protein K0R10_3001, partial [Alphaproteobacteria bacterium]|nr:hypothetical protein [Alphaproteobacteria bacterium]